MSKMLNLTRRLATIDQAMEGVVDLYPIEMGKLQEALEFDYLPTDQEILDRVGVIVALALNNGLGSDEGAPLAFKYAMIGGAPWLMHPLASGLREVGIKPLFAFSRQTGALLPTHEGWVLAP